MRLAFATSTSLALLVTLLGSIARADDPPPGFRSLSDSGDLSHWQPQILNGDPRKVMALSPEERRAEREKRQADLDAHWKVEGDEIVNDGKGPYLETVEEFGDFELHLDWKITAGADSGIYLRSTPQVQIWDPVNGIDQAKVGSGGLYNNGKYPSQPLVNADKPAGEWNHFHITMIGDVVTVRLNDQLVVNEVPLENYWDRSQPLFTTGPLQIQTHGGELRLRNVHIREIPRRPSESGTLDNAGNPVGEGWKKLADAGDELADFELHATIPASDDAASLLLRQSGDVAWQIGLTGDDAGQVSIRGGDGVVSAAGAPSGEGETRHVYVLAQNDCVEAWIDGQQVANVYCPRAPKSGAIAVEGSEGAVVLVRPAAENPALAYRPYAKEDGFETMFDGESLDGWVGSVNGYAAEDGKLVCRRRGGGNLYIAEPQSNFVLRFEFKLQSGANNGVGIRAERGKDAAYYGMEIQVLDNTADGYAKLAPYQYHGSIYGVVAAKRGYQRPLGTWNVEEIHADGNHVRVTLNGEVIVDADIEKESTEAVRKSHPGLLSESGHIGFLGHGHRIEFRRIELKKLD